MVLLGILLAGLWKYVWCKQRRQRNSRSTNGFEHVIQKIDEGQTGLLLIAEEEDNRPLNQLVMFDLGGEITRLDLEEVQQEINDANEVANEAKQSWQAKEQHKEATSKEE